MNLKRANGQFYTVKNPFNCKPFRAWARKAHLPGAKVLEPFAGCNSLIDHLKDIRLISSWDSYDIAPQAKGIFKRDTLLNFPEGYPVCITNPPWLARNSATVRGLPFPDCAHDDIYKLALEKCLENCGHVAALVPESFIRANIFQERLHSFISLTSEMFDDTSHPVGLALFLPETTKDIDIYSGQEYVGTLGELEKLRPHPHTDADVMFNIPDGNLGLIALDNTQGPSIRFCDVRELSDYDVKKSGRHITKMLVQGKLRIEEYNYVLEKFRQKTRDVLLTSYRGLRKDGRYRRRLDWALARDIVCHVST